MRPSKRNGEMLKRLKELNDWYTKNPPHITNTEEIMTYFLSEILKDFYPKTRTILEEKVSK
jgi:hypothetical protein